jgi:hypothetical protein
MSNQHLPEILDGLDYENQFLQRTSGAQRRTVKLPNRGDSWLLRFLPAQLGPNKRWYARVAKHWVNQRAIVCPRDTEEAFGGHPDAYCSVCDLSMHLNEERSEEISKFGFKLRSTPNWITYCAVFEKATNGGSAQAMPTPEILQPYEFQHYKTTWEELKTFVQHGARRTPLSIFDFEKGNDIYVTKTPKGLRLDKQDSGPIFDLNDPNFDANCEKLMAACKDPVVKIPDEKALDAFADKAQEEADNIARGGSGGARGGRGAPRRGGPDEDDLPPEDAPRSRRVANEGQTAAAPAPRGRTAAPADPAPVARRTAAPPVDPAPARRTAAPPAAAPLRRAPAPAPEPPQEEYQNEGDPGAEGDQPLPDEAGGEMPPEEQAQEQAPPPARRAAPAPAPAPARTAATRPSASASRAAAAPARTAAPRGGPVAQESIDEHENIPEESSDQAPPEPLADPANDAGASEEPPAVDNTRRGQFGSAIRGKIAAVNGTTKK